MWRATEDTKTAVTGAYFAEVFARTKRMESLGHYISKIFRGDAPRSIEEQADAARRFLGAKKKQAS